MPAGTDTQSALPLNDTTRTVRLSVDCMGAITAPSVTLPACRSFLDRHPDAELVLVGTEQALAPAAGWRAAAW